MLDERSPANWSGSWPRWSGGRLARQSLEEFGAVILVADRRRSRAAGRRDRPEHLHIATENADELLTKIRHAGAMFLGNYSPWPWAIMRPARRTCCPPAARPGLPADLSANDFLRAGSVIHFSREALAAVADDIGNWPTKKD